MELNTIASGFGWMGPASGLIHKLVKTMVSHLVDPVILVPVLLANLGSLKCMKPILHCFRVNIESRQGFNDAGICKLSLR